MTGTFCMTISHMISRIKATKRDTIQALTYSLSKHSSTKIPKIPIEAMISMKLCNPMLQGNSSISQTAAIMRVAANLLLLDLFV